MAILKSFPFLSRIFRKGDSKFVVSILSGLLCLFTCTLKSYANTPIVDEIGREPPKQQMVQSSSRSGSEYDDEKAEEPEQQNLTVQQVKEQPFEQNQSKPQQFQPAELHPSIEHVEAQKEEDLQSGSNTLSKSQLASPQALVLGRVERLRLEVQQLRAQLEEQSDLVAQLKNQLQTLNNKSNVAAGVNDTSNPAAPHTPNTHFSATQGNPQAAASTLLQSGTPANTENVELNAESAEVEQQLVYEAAYKEIKYQHYSQAKQDMLSFLKQYPRSSYVVSAHYWLGELYLIEGNLSGAEKEFQLVAQQKRQPQKVAEALYKLGDIQYAKQNYQQAQTIWNEVIRKDPRSTAADLAKKRLVKMHAA